MSLGHAGVPADVLEALGKGKEERVEHMAGQQDLAGAVPAHLEAHPPKTLLDGLECGAQHGFLDRFEVVAARRLWRGRCPESQLAEKPRVIRRLLPQGRRRDTHARVGQKGQGGQNRIVKQPSALTALGLGLTCLPLGAVRAANARDSTRCLGHTRADPKTDDRREDPTQEQQRQGSQGWLVGRQQQGRQARDRDERDTQHYSAQRIGG